MNWYLLAVIGLLSLITVVTGVVLVIRKDVLNLGLVVKQVSSGRWLLTVSAGLAFLLFCIAVVIVILAQRFKFKAETVVAMLGSLLLVIQGVYKDYFNRERESDSDVNGKQNGSQGHGPQGPQG